MHATVLHQLGLDPAKLTYFFGGLDNSLVGVEGAAADLEDHVVGCNDCRNRLVIPAGMDNTQPVEVKPHRQRGKPFDGSSQVLIRELENRLSVLANIPDVPAAKIFFLPMNVLSMKCQSVEFMVPHDSQRIAGFDHRLHRFQNLQNLRSAINEIAKEDYFAFRMFIDTLVLPVAKEFKELNQFAGMAVNVADQIVHELFSQGRG
jgi:hypothetical protein